MRTRKIRLSQTMTLSFRDISMSGADGNAAASILNQETDQASSNETFDSLPDLFPYIFQSQEKSSAPDVPCFVTGCSPYKLWESCKADVIPLASQIEAEHWLLTGTHISPADNLDANDNDSIPVHCARVGLRENLRLVQAFSPHTSNVLYVDPGELRSEELHCVNPGLRSALAAVTCDAAPEFASHPNSLDIHDDTDGTICPDSYLNLDEDFTKVDTPLEEFPVADATCDAAIEIERRADHLLDIGGITDGVFADRYLDILNGDERRMTKEADSPSEEPTLADVEMVNSRLSSISKVRPSGPEEHNGKALSKIKKTQAKSLTSIDQTSDFHSLDFPKQIRKQKRSIAPRRREGPSASTDLVHKTNWMSDAGTKQYHLGPGDQSPQATEDLPDMNEKKTGHTRKTKKRTISISSGRKLFSEPQDDQIVKPQPRGRPGKRKKQLRSAGSLNGEE